MPRIARIKSKSSIYHIMLRGTNRQEIFHDEEDCDRFLYTLKKCKEKSSIEVYAWCLMDNHVHILIKEGKEEIAVTMKRLGVSYAWYYNWKYKTTGHLFQDRYRSENIEDEKYLLAVVRYIHQNPVKAGMVKRPGDWKYSSCQSYYGNIGDPASLLDDSLLLNMFSHKRELGISKFKEYNETKNEDEFLEDIPSVRLSDEEAKIEIKKIITEYELASIKSLGKDKRDKVVTKVKKINGITQRQISRILGIPLSLINRA